MAEDDRQREQIDAVDQLRKVLADGMSFVRGAESSRSISSFSYEELLDRAIRDLSEDESDIRLCPLSTVRQLRDQVRAAVDRALAMPAQVFRLNSSEDVANTSEEGRGPTGEDES